MNQSSPISAQQWMQVQRLLDELELLAPEKRSAALAASPVSDVRVRDEVASLLEADAASGAFLERPPWRLEAAAARTPSLAPGTVLGAFRIETLIGRGGTAEVYRAHRMAEFEQCVAIKLISGEASTRLDAFQRERRILAALEHPGIARIVDGGITEAGRPYMVMEYVEGTDLIRHALGRSLGLRARLDLFRQVCEAVAYAHRHLVIHRDLKPGNIRVTPDGQVKLLDFGVAKLLRSSSRGEDFETATVLTPEFAAPEQLYGDPVTTATDVYALGAVLFHLLTGVPPFPPGGRSLHLVIDQRLRSDMPRPSEVAESQSEPPVPVRQLRGDLDAIVARAARRRPADRYPSVDELWADLARHLAHERVLAHRGSTLEGVLRRLRRHRIAIPLAAGVMATLGAGVASVVWQAHLAVRAEHASVQQAERARKTKAFFVATFADAAASSDGLNAALGRALLRAQTLEDADPRLQAELLAEFVEIREAQGDWVSARDIARQVFALRSRQPVARSERAEALVQLAEAELRLGQYASAFEHASDALPDIRHVDDTTGVGLSDALLIAAAAAFETGRLDEARRWAKQAYARTAAGPVTDGSALHAVVALRLLGRLAQAQGDDVSERAARLDAATRSAQRVPQQYPAVLLELAQMEFRLGDSASARDRLQQAVTSADQHGLRGFAVIEAYRLLATEQLRSEDFGAARTTLDAGMRVCSDPGELPEEAMGCLGLRAVQLKLLRPEPAQQPLHTVLNLDAAPTADPVL